jgi:Aldehyde dehydrogenase family
MAVIAHRGSLHFNLKRARMPPHLKHGARNIAKGNRYGHRDATMHCILKLFSKQANDTVYGLAASVWTRDGGLAHKMAKRLRAGTVWINCHNVFDASLPFGGYKQSGWGREMGEEVTEIKAVTTALWFTATLPGGEAGSLSCRYGVASGSRSPKTFPL